MKKKRKTTSKCAAKKKTHDLEANPKLTKCLAAHQREREKVNNIPDCEEKQLGVIKSYSKLTHTHTHIHGGFDRNFSRRKLGNLVLVGEFSKPSAISNVVGSRVKDARIPRQPTFQMCNVMFFVYIYLKLNHFKLCTSLRLVG